jgi:hypothetical protein
MSSIREGKIQKRKTPTKYCNIQKWANAKKRPNEWITLAYAHQKTNDTKQLSQKKVMVRKRELVRHKKTKQKGKVETTNLLPHIKALRKWLSRRWCEIHL